MKGGVNLFPLAGASAVGFPLAGASRLLKLNDFFWWARNNFLIRRWHENLLYRSQPKPFPHLHFVHLGTHFLSHFLYSLHIDYLICYCPELEWLSVPYLVLFMSKKIVIAIFANWTWTKYPCC